MCLDYLGRCQNIIYKENPMMAAGMNFAITYFQKATEHLAEEERPFDEELERKMAGWE
jgi:hypothetical protein